MKGRVLVAKLGLDGHDVGAKVVARILRDAGYEVVYLGIRHTPDAVASVAVDEDVDLIGVSLLSGAHLPLVTRLLDALRRRDVAVPVVVGGVVPTQDRDALLAAGVAAVAARDTTSSEIVELVGRLLVDNPTEEVT